MGNIDAVLKQQPFYKRILALLLGVVFLSSTNGIAVGAHYCQGNLQDLGLFSKAKTCYELAGHNKGECDKDQDCEHKPNGVKKKNCCQDKCFFSKLSIENNLQPEFEFLSLAAIQVSSHLKLRKPDTYQIKPALVLWHDPPQQSTSRTVLFQVFRI